MTDKHVGSVPPHPVVEIDVSTEGVAVNGDPVDVSDVAFALWPQAGVHAAAVRVAQELGRPVRAIARDVDGAELRLIVNVDGTSSEVDDGTPAPTTWSRLVAAKAASKTARATGTPGSVGAVGTAGSRLDRRGRLALAVGALLVAVSVVGWAVALRPSDGPTSGQVSMGTEPLPDPTPTVTPSPTTRPAPPAKPAPPAVRLRPHVTGLRQQIEVRVTSNRRTEVRWQLRSPSGRPVVDRRFDVGPRGKRFEISNLRAGRYTWRATPIGSGRQAATGKTVVKPALTPPKPPAADPPPVDPIDPIEAVEPIDPPLPPPPPPSGNGGGGGGNGGGGGVGSNGGGGSGGGGGNNGPVDPDEPSGPIDPDDT